jgi:hypothetical protein
MDGGRISREKGEKEGKGLRLWDGKRRAPGQAQLHVDDCQRDQRTTTSEKKTRNIRRQPVASPGSPVCNCSTGTKKWSWPQNTQAPSVETTVDGKEIGGLWNLGN